MGHGRIFVQKICRRILPSQRLGGVTGVLWKDVSVFGLVLPLVHDILWLLLSAGPMVVMSARGRANGESRMVVSCFLHLLCHMLNDRFLIVIPCGDSFNVLAYHDFWCDFLHIWQWRGSPRWNGSGAPDLLDKFPKTSEQSSLATSPLKCPTKSCSTNHQWKWKCFSWRPRHLLVKLQEGVFCTTLVTFVARFQFHCPGYRLKACCVQLRVVL